MTMETIPFTQFRSHLAQTLEAVDRGSDTCVISRRGRPAGVLMSYESYLGLTQGQRGFAARLAQWRQVAQPVLEATAAEEEPFTDDLRDREVRERPDPWAA